MANVLPEDRIKTPDGVISLLREQAQLYEKLEKMGQRQRALISLDDTLPLLRLLADRQRVIESLSKVGELLRPVRSKWEVYSSRFNKAQKAEADELIASAQACVERLLAEDAKDAKLLSAKKEATAKSLRQVPTSNKAISAYKNGSGGVASPGRFEGES